MGLLRHLTWLAQAGTDGGTEVGIGRLTIVATLLGVIITGAVTVAVALINSRTNAKVAQATQEVKDDNAAFRQENTEQHGNNVLALMAIQQRQQMVLAALGRQETLVQQMSEQLAMNAEQLERLDLRLTLHDDRLFEIEKAAKGTHVKLTHMEGELAEQNGYSEKIRAVLIPLLPADWKQALEGIPAWRQRNPPRPQKELPDGQ